MLSTHIMQEVQAICDRVIIINKGKLVADDRTENLAAAASDHIALTVSFKEEVDAESLSALPGVRSVQALGSNRWKLDIDEGQAVRAGTSAEEMIFRFAVERGLTLTGSEKEKRNMEDIFRQLTQNPLTGPTGSSKASSPEHPASGQ